MGIGRTAVATVYNVVFAEEKRGDVERFFEINGKDWLRKI